MGVARQVSTTSFSSCLGVALVWVSGVSGATAGVVRLVAMLFLELCLLASAVSVSPAA